MNKKEYTAIGFDDSALFKFILDYNDSVTTRIENLFQESIKLTVLNQQYQGQNQYEWPDVGNDEPLLYRNVFLSGGRSNRRYLYASSVIRTAYLKSEVVDALLEQKMAIGKIIQQYKLKVDRERTEIKLVDSEIICAMLNTKGGITSRAYRLNIDKVTTMHITEYYPHQLYCGLQ